MVPVLPGEGEHMQSWGGMGGVCRMIIAVHNLMVLQFSLLTQWIPG